MINIINTNNVQYETIEGLSIEQELISQLNVLLTTPVGTVVLDRDFGLDYSFLDMPLNVATVMFTNELAEKIEKHIPSIQLATMQLIDFTPHNASTLKFKVVIEYVG